MWRDVSIHSVFTWAMTCWYGCVASHIWHVTYRIHTFDMSRDVSIHSSTLWYVTWLIHPFHHALPHAYTTWHIHAYVYKYIIRVYIHTYRHAARYIHIHFCISQAAVMKSTRHFWSRIHMWHDVFAYATGSRAVGKSHVIRGHVFICDYVTDIPQATVGRLHLIFGNMP